MVTLGSAASRRRRLHSGRLASGSGFCRERLAHYKCPDAIELGALPKTSTGKIQKFVLRDGEWAGHDNRIGATKRLGLAMGLAL
jgi:acyl-coenzyme A synthetase/AMP-(fatty) acid ligase